MSEGVIWHLLPSGAWPLGSPGCPDQYRPASLDTEGFVHCTAGVDRLLRVANLFYVAEPGPFVAIALDEGAVAAAGAEVRWEAPAGGAPDGDEGALFPHVYGPLPQAAVVGVHPVERAPDGTFLAVGAAGPS